MTNCLYHSLGKQKLVAATHPYDGTCRPQVSKDNKIYYDIEKFGKLTGTLKCLNTFLLLENHYK